MQHTKARWIARCSLGLVILAGAAGCSTPQQQAAPNDLQNVAMTDSASSVVSSPTAAAAQSTDSSGKVTAPAAAPRLTVPGPDKAFLLVAVDRVEDPALTVTASNRIGTYPSGADTGDREQFMLTPLSPGATTYLLKTARLRVGGEPLCAGIKTGVLTAVACDAAAKSQKVTLVARSTTTFDLVVGGYQVEVSKLGKVSLAKAGNAAAKTRFRFVPAGTVGQWP
ncbi:hypothetical protein Cme02nite_37200 [Catellatospora methionotrophica]|uniref:Lipoprotein n=1 Tax=Catellatospora methionotrophica TaxID=121620 RepID=A0A8J3LC09_9ACTN|nr:hypothetical protein [Catellatospora methionotrophica]GIG15388.1 hypothetical protein Cme02nite_37200 [Catellatospora methionotrophica]